MAAALSTLRKIRFDLGIYAFAMCAPVVVVIAAAAAAAACCSPQRVGDDDGAASEQAGERAGGRADERVGRANAALAHIESVKRERESDAAAAATRGG